MHPIDTEITNFYLHVCVTFDRNLVSRKIDRKHCSGEE